MNNQPSPSVDASCASPASAAAMDTLPDTSELKTTQKLPEGSAVPLSLLPPPARNFLLPLVKTPLAVQVPVCTGPLGPSVHSLPLLPLAPVVPPPSLSSVPPPSKASSLGPTRTGILIFCEKLSGSDAII